MDELARNAIIHALSGNWEEAIKVNQLIINDDNQDVDALNRLAKAYSELGNPKKSKEALNKVLKIDPLNPIAQKAITKGFVGSTSKVSPGTFLEEPGKTRQVDLRNLGDKKVTSKLNVGDSLKMTCHQHRVSISTPEGKYVGIFPDDLAARTRELIKGGNLYDCIVKTAGSDRISVFVREIEKSEKMKGVVSFPMEKASNSDEQNQYLSE
ncbi:MAG: tetratricopeptide repeat protein [Patescibacteria group bacterium]